MSRIPRALLFIAVFTGFLAPSASAQVLDLAARKSELLKAEETLRANELLKLKQERDEKRKNGRKSSP